MTARPLAADASALPFAIKRHADRKSIDVFFPPYRDESKGTMTLRLIAADGRSSIVTFPGGSCDPGKRSAMPDPTQATAKPGDDLQEPGRSIRIGDAFGRELTGSIARSCSTGR